MNVVLISTYELGRQPFGLASPAAWLRQEGCTVTCMDVAIERLNGAAVVAADLVAFYVPMHTATRIAASLVGRIKRLNPKAHLCFYALYAPVNETYLRELGADTILGGEFEAGLVSLVRRLSQARDTAPVQMSQPEPLISLDRQAFRVPDRDDLPALSTYAQLQMAPDELKTVGYTEATRGCKHLCRHCPVVPVYQGNFRVVQRHVVLDDIRQQVTMGAQHITFGDPDFFNGPTHAMAIVKDMHEAFPDLTYDVTIKVEHLLQQARHLPVLRDTGCLFVTCAVESMDNDVLEIFDKGHTREDFVQAVHLFREVGLQMNPTFVTFTPWTSLQNYLALLHTLLDLDLVDNVAPIQYAIRLLIAGSSKLLELEAVRHIIGPFDMEKLIYPWVHPDPRVDTLCDDVLQAVQTGQERDESRRQIFQRVWKLAHEAYDGTVYEASKAAALDQAPALASVPFLTEPWYC